MLRRLGPWGVSLHAVWIAAVLLAVLGVTTEGPAAASLLTTEQWAAIGYLAVMVTAVAFLLWYSAVAALGSAQGGSVDRGGSGLRSGQRCLARRRAARGAGLGGMLSGGVRTGLRPSLGGDRPPALRAP